MRQEVVRKAKLAQVFHLSAGPTVTAGFIAFAFDITK
jgi:hypothetical protein